MKQRQRDCIFCADDSQPKEQEPPPPAKIDDERQDEEGALSVPVVINWDVGSSINCHLCR
jgi:hypothetical protein